MYLHRKKAVFQIVIALVLAAAVLGSIGSVSQGQSSSPTSNWTDPIALSPAGAYSWFPDIAADEYGNLHVVWASGVLGFDSVIYTTSANGVDWRTPNDVFALIQEGFGSAATRPTLLVDHQSNLHISFVDLTTVYYSRVQLWDASNALSWLPKETMSGKQTSYFSRMAIDSKNHLHYVFTENVPSVTCSNCYHIFYRQSVDGGDTWSDPIDLIGDQEGAVKPQILIDKKDNIHVVWESGQGGGLGQLTDPTYVTYAASYDNGATWTKAIDFPLSEDEMAKNITIGLDHDNHLVVAWWSLPLDWIMYQTSADDGKTWSEPTPIPEVWGAASVYRSNLDDYSMASDSAGNLHLVAVGRIDKEQKDLNIVDLVWDGTEWAKPDVIATYQGDVPEWPRITVNKGNQLDVVWFVRDEAHIWQSDKGRYRVWYSKGLGSSSPIFAKALPSLTPTLEATEVLTPTSTVDPLTGEIMTTPEPTINLADKTPPVHVPVSETDYIPLLAKALLPSVLFLAGIVVVAFIRRR